MKMQNIMLGNVSVRQTMQEMEYPRVVEFKVYITLYDTHAQ